MNENYIIYAEPVSSIKTIKPVEVKNPRHLNIVYESTSGVVDSIVEFDTDESAQDWRRELLGAFCPGAPKCVSTLLYRRTVLVSQESPFGFDAG